jgi:gamma-glutamyltranspeptidase
LGVMNGRDWSKYKDNWSQPIDHKYMSINLKYCIIW